MIEEIKAIVSGNEAAAQMVEEFQIKANKKLDQWNKKLATAALERLKAAGGDQNES